MESNYFLANRRVKCLPSFRFKNKPLFLLKSMSIMTEFKYKKNPFLRSRHGLVHLFLIRSSIVFQRPILLFSNLTIIPLNRALSKIVCSIKLFVK